MSHGQKSVFVLHKRAIQTHEELEGRIYGRLMFSASILSDTQEMLCAGVDPDVISQEIDEAKELIFSVMVRCDRICKPKTDTSQNQQGKDLQ